MVAQPVLVPPITITTTRGAGVDRLKMLVIGASGAGKTTLCGTTGDPEHTLILSAEAGLLPLRDRDIDVAQISSIEDLQSVYSWLRTDRSYRWLCLDSLSEVAEVCLSTEKKLTKDGRRAYGEMQDRMSKIIRAFRDLPMHVVMLAGQDRVQDDTGALLYGPLLPGKNLPVQVPYLFDEVLHLHVGRDQEGKTVRWLQTELSATHYAKDRSGALDPTEPADLAGIATKILGESAETNNEETP